MLLCQIIWSYEKTSNFIGYKMWTGGGTEVLEEIFWRHLLAEVTAYLFSLLAFV